jgi:mannan endo-1,4-beta-mannosidase
VSEPTDGAKSEPTSSQDTASEQGQTAARADEPETAPSPGGETSTHGASSVSPPAVEGATEDGAGEPAEASPAPVHTNTMRVSGNQLLDACGQPFVVRGVEQILGNQLPQGNDWIGLVREIAATGANAVRILPGVNTLTTEDVDDILTYVGSQGMVAFIDPLNSPDDWYARDDVKAMLKKHESFLIIDAYGEPQYDDIEKWRGEAKEALVRMRELGYEVPFTVYANQFGRGLPSLFDHGAEILAADPLHNTFLGWQAYWGQGGYYQEHYGYSFDEAVAAIVASGLPIQMGLDHVTDLPSETADYGALMRGAEANGIGWLWWDFYNPYGAENNLSEDGTADNLTFTGADVLESHEASIANTAQRACSR